MNSSILIFLCIIGIAVAANVKTKFEKKSSATKASLLSAEEMFHRYQKAQKEVDELNKKYPSATFAINKFSFMSEAERKKFHGASPAFPKFAHFDTFDDENITAPESYDYREHGYVSPVKSQQLCGSCYDFAATGAVESQYLIQQDLELDLSEEYVLECDALDGECVSGWPIHALDVYKTSGVPTEDCDPYTATNGTCPVLDADCEIYKIAGYRAVGTDEDKYAGLLYKYGPITFAFNEGKNFDNYHGGIMDFPLEECGTDGHAVLLVGYTEDYWIAKNSWDTTWGEEGFFRFKRGINWCNFAKYADNLIPYLDDTTTTSVAP